MLLLTAALAFAQDSYVAARQAALVLEQLHNYSEAETAWISLSRTYPKNPEPYARWALLEARQEHYKEAVPLYRTAIKLNPNAASSRKLSRNWKLFSRSLLPIHPRPSASPFFSACPTTASPSTTRPRPF